MPSTPNTDTGPQQIGLEYEDIAGKAIVVTGGTKGIGRATARMLAWKGAKVLIFGREEQPLSDALADIKEVAKGEVYGITADASKTEDVKRVFEEADRRLGGLDILINNAAVGGGSIMDSDFEEWQSIIHTNILGYMLCCKEAIPRLKKKGKGHIVNVGSMSAKVREAGSDIYVATKSAIEGFSDSLARQLNKEGIRVTCIEPGLAGTDMTAGNTPPEEQPRKEEEMTMMKAEDLAQCVYYVLTQPQRVDVALVHIKPLKQII